jgi:hypothetical protein
MKILIIMKMCNNVCKYVCGVINESNINNIMAK